VRGNNSVWVLGRHIGRVAEGNAGAACQIGFRPQTGSLSYSEGLEIEGQISGLEYTGAELIVTVRLAQAQESCVLCLPSSQPGLRVGAPMRVWVPLEAIHVFAADGQRLAFNAQPAVLDAAA